jgi:hypothetical protein
MREADTFCWTCGARRGADDAGEERLAVVTTPTPRSRPSGRQSGRVIVVFSIALVAAVGVAAWWLLRPDDDTASTSATTPSASAPPSSAAGEPAAAQTEPAPSETPAPAVTYPTGILAPASVTAPRSSPDSADAAGRTTSYEAANVLDGRTSTAWRMEGSGVGESLTFSFDAPVRITEVAMVNGFAKIDPADGTDRYPQGRRITEVTWTFTTATGPVVVTQDLTDGDRALQALTVAPVETTAVELTLDAVTAPGSGGRFDRTAISEVQFSNAG